MKKLYTIALAALLTPAIAMADATDAQYFDNYAAYQGTSSHGSTRGCSKLVVSDDLGNSLEIAGPGHANHTIFTDASASSILTTKAGATLTLNGTSTNAEWMHNYVFIDFDNDGRFDVDLESTVLNGDLVAFTGYSLTVSGGDTTDPTLQSDGKATNNGNYWDMPTITLPADMKPGTYRVRLKNDWNSTHPYGRTNDTSVGGQKADNAINSNGGYIIDFSIVIEAEETLYDFFLQGIFGNVKVYADADMSNLLMQTSGSEDGDDFSIAESEMTDGLYLEVIPEEGYVLSQLLVNGMDFASDVIEGVCHIDLDQLEYNPEACELTIIAVCETAAEPVETYELWICGEKGAIALFSDAEFNNQIAYDNDSVDGQELTFTSEDCKDGLYIVTYPNDQLKLKSLWINGSYYTEQVVDDVLYIADVTSFPYFDSMGLQICATYEVVELSGIEEVAVDLNAADVEYFNLQGVRVAADNLASGVYVARQGDKTMKVVIKK